MSPELLEKEVQDLKNSVDWYKKTFEERKLAGIAKDRFINFFKKKKKKKTRAKEHHGVEVSNTFVTDENAKQYLRKNNELLQQRFLHSSHRNFVIKTPENCESFFQFNAETILATGNSLFIAGWLADPAKSIKEM